MDKDRIDSFKQFAKYLEYPMVVFEAESGKVLDINYEAEVLIGGNAVKIHLEPGRAMTKINFWEKLHDKKTVMWQRMRLFADDREYLINGLVNEAVSDGKTIYSLMFEKQTDTSFGGVILERVLNQAGAVAVYLGREGDGFRVEFISKNINRYGYTREQFYEGIIHLADLVCPEDWERVEESMEDAVRSHENDLEFSCRIFTEIKELIPVRVNVRYVYNDYGKLTDVELLIIDSREELRRNSENMHLNNAISKMKNVVMVKSYHAGKRTLVYISPNAGMVGMNVEALSKGYKLTEDYIHPDDRDEVIDGIYQAVANGVTDYNYTYRMVRDDGKLIWVLSEATITRISDGEAEISVLLTDITEQKEIEKELAAARERVSLRAAKTKREAPVSVNVDKDDKELLEQFCLLTETLNQNADYYTVVLDWKGKLLTNPVGPADEMGQFYDLFERRQFKEQFINVSAKANELGKPQSASFAVDRLQVHMVLASIATKGAVIAYLLLTSFKQDGLDRIGSVIEQQSRLANAVVKCLYAEEMELQEQKYRKLAEMHLEKERRSRQVVSDILDCIVAKAESGIGEACQNAGVFLSVINIGLYKENKDEEKTESYYTWNRFGEDGGFFDAMAMTALEFKTLRECMKDNGYVVADKTSAEPFIKEMLRKTGMEVIFVRHMVMGFGQRGYIVFADDRKRRKFEEKEIGFMVLVSQVFEGMLVSNQKMIRAQSVKETFIEAYDYIRDAVFVKDNQTGDIIFANKAMDKLFGYSVVGMPAGAVVSDQMEQYKNISTVGKRFIANKKVTKWQRYMKELDQNMNIVEVHMELFNDTDCSLYILKKSKIKK